MSYLCRAMVNHARETRINYRDCIGLLAAAVIAILRSTKTAIGLRVLCETVSSGLFQALSP